MNRSTMWLLSALTLVLGCGPGGSSETDQDTAEAELVATLDLPPAPWWDSDGLARDEALLAAQAGAWCEATGGEGGVAAFFFGAMPLETVGALCSSDAETIPVLLGHMYLSGYYGGLWFRDNADLGMGGGGEGPPFSSSDEEEFLAIADNAAALAALAADGSDEDVTAHNLESLIPPPGGDLMESMMNALLTLFGYNYGYVQAILDAPPEGVDGTTLSMPCDAWLDCPFDGTPLHVYSPYRTALEQLAAPPDATWEALAAESEKSQGWIAIGQGLWSGGEISPEAWAVLVEINASYLRVNNAAVLASLLGAGDGDAAAGRCGLLLEAAADTWNRAYFMALGADAPVGTLPGLTCPE